MERVRLPGFALAVGLAFTLVSAGWAQSPAPERQPAPSARRTSPMGPAPMMGPGMGGAMAGDMRQLMQACLEMMRSMSAPAPGSGPK